MRDFEDESGATHDLGQDILDSIQEMENIDISSLPMFVTHFDPIKWQEENHTYHLCVYKSNREQLQDWGEIVTEIRNKIYRHAELTQDNDEIPLESPKTD